MYFPNTKQGFTIVEMAVVVGILALLLSITLIAINPARLFADARNTKRQSDIKAILEAITQYTVDQKGVLTASVSASPQFISDSGANLCFELVPRYLAAFPRDPSINNGQSITECSNYNSYYQVFRDLNNRVTVLAPGTEAPAPTLSITR